MQASTNLPTTLLVTLRHYPGSAWADVAHSAGAGLKLWRERRHATVFADFGPLGRGISGVRFARLLRTQSNTAHLYLLSDRADDAQKVWARANGADDVIKRDAALIAACLSGLGPQDRPGESAQALTAQVTRPFQLHSRVGPAAQIVVEDVQAELGLRAGRTPTLRELVEALAGRIRDDGERQSFLLRFNLREVPAHAPRHV